MQQTPSLPIDFAPFRSVSVLKALVWSLGLGALVCGFLVWLVYFKGASAERSALVAKLPAVNASLNGLSATFLVTGYVAIRRGNWRRHMRWMFAALATSALFFVGYVVYHNSHGDTKFTGTGPVRPVYFFILITHIVLSAIVVPMVLTSLYLALAGRMATHRRVSRWTLPIWLYVSVTGVVIFVMLKVFNPAPAA